MTKQPDPLREAHDIILNGGLRVPGFDHWRERASSKPSDPDDIRWDCSCGYAGSPETVQRHWSALRATLRLTDTPAPDLTLCFEPGCTLPGHVSRVHEADTAAPDLCPECAHPLTEHQTPGGECVHAFCTHDESFEIVLSALREAQD